MAQTNETDLVHKFIAAMSTFSDRANELEKMVREELSSIRQEISQLRQEIGEFQSNANERVADTFTQVLEKQQESIDKIAAAEAASRKRSQELLDKSVFGMQPGAVGDESHKALDQMLYDSQPSTASSSPSPQTADPEKQDVVLTTRCCIYHYDPSQQLAERGRGEITIWQDSKTRQLRCVMNSEQHGFAACANFPVQSVTKIGALKNRENILSIMCTDFSDNLDGHKTTLVLRFKDADDANTFKECLQQI